MTAGPLKVRQPVCHACTYWTSIGCVGSTGDTVTAILEKRHEDRRSRDTKRVVQA
jgi:hypothetical protein